MAPITKPPPEHLLRLDTHPFLADHVLSGHPVLPLASALDVMAWHCQLEPPWAMTDVRVRRGVTLWSEEARIRVERDGGQLQLLEVRPGGRTARAFEARIADEIPPAPAPVDDGDPQPIELSLAEFYDAHTFHRPRLHGITSLSRLSANSLEATVRGSHPTDLQPHDPRAHWQLDPLALDSCFQLGLYWTYVRLKRGLLPVSIDALGVLHSIEPAPLHVRVELAQAEPDQLACHIRLSQHGHLVAWIENLRGRIVPAWNRRDRA